MQQQNNFKHDNSEVCNKQDKSYINSALYMLDDESTFNVIRNYKLTQSSPKVNSALIAGELSIEVIGDWNGKGAADIIRSTTTITGRAWWHSRINRIHVKRSVRSTFGKKTLPFKMRRDDLCVYPVDCEALIYDPTVQTLHHLNEPAYYVWCLIERQSPKDLAHSLNKKFNVDLETAIDHITEIIRLFRMGGLLTVEPQDEFYE